MPIFSPFLILFKESIVVATFMETIQKLRGIHKVIVSDKSDRNPIFTRTLWTELFLFGYSIGSQLLLPSSI
jgi:hypothetical protein